MYLFNKLKNYLVVTYTITRNNLLNKYYFTKYLNYLQYRTNLKQNYSKNL